MNKVQTNTHPDSHGCPAAVPGQRRGCPTPTTTPSGVPVCSQLIKTFPQNTLRECCEGLKRTLRKVRPVYNLVQTATKSSITKLPSPRKKLVEINLGCFLFLRADRPDHSHHNENFTFNLNYSQIYQILNSMHEGDGFSAKTLGKSLFNLQNDWSGHGLAG